MTLTDRHLDELKRERLAHFEADVRRYSELAHADPDAFGPLTQRAMRFHDTLALCALGEGLMEAGERGLKILRKLGLNGVVLDAEVQERRYEQALKIFNGAPRESWQAAKAWRAAAVAYAALGHLQRALDAAKTAVELEPNLRGPRDLADLIQERGRLKVQIEQAERITWPDLQRLLDVYLALDMRAHASRLLQRRLKDLPEPGPDDYEPGLEVMRAALPLQGPEYVLRHAQPLAKVASDDRLKALFVECLIALGRPEDGAKSDEGGRDLRLQRALAVAGSGRTEEAVHRLGRHAVKRRTDLEVRAALGFYVGRHVLQENPLELRPAGGRRRIFNLMPFNDEIELLKIHLEEMWDWVDLFVVTEAEVTFTGQPKPLHFETRRHEFARYADKVRHVVVRQHPPIYNGPWSRDFRQRDLAVTAISGLAAADDLVLLTDVDEIVDRRALEGFDGDMACLRMAMFRFFLNYRPDADNFPERPTGAVVRAHMLQRFGSSYLRFELARQKKGLQVNWAGWHFTSVCDPGRLVAKINSYAHQERGGEWRDVDHVDRLLSQIKSGDLERGWERAEIDDSFPAYIREHQDELADLLISASPEHAA